MSKLFAKFAVTGFIASALLSGCVAQKQVQVTAEVEAPIEAEEVQEPQLPTLFISWPLTEQTLISPPIAVQQQGIEACQARGYDTSYMIHIAIDGDMAVAEFGCRGSD